MTRPLLHLAQDDKERASSIDEQRIDKALGIALFFSLFLSASFAWMLGRSIGLDRVLGIAIVERAARKLDEELGITP
ncbi:hypothetical protein Tco_1331497 [Tanacetum coccineum]